MGVELKDNALDLWEFSIGNWLKEFGEWWPGL